jgi:hypothetical protein
MADGRWWMADGGWPMADGSLFSGEIWERNPDHPKILKILIIDSHTLRLS